MAERVAVPRAGLPRGRHSLSRRQVEESQRLRLAVALAEAMVEKGYVGTPVAAVLRRAGVSRQTFYELYDDKQACFLDALDLAGAVLTAELGDTIGGAGEPLDRAERAVGQYLDLIVANPAFARLYLVEVHAAGATALRRRAELQSSLTDSLAALLGARSRRARFACQSFIAATSALVTVPVVTGDLEAVAALRRPLTDHLRALVDAGIVGAAVSRPA